MAARLVDKMDGRIGVDTELGVGSRFWFELPGGTDAPPVTTEAVSSAQTGQTEQTTGVVLYIEDDPGCIDLIVAALALRPGVELVSAGTAADGLGRARAGGIDAVLLDVGLPDRSGWDVLAELRGDPSTAGIPVVILTAGAQTTPPGDDAPEFTFTKPLDVSTTLRAIDLVLGPISDQPTKFGNLLE